MDALSFSVAILQTFAWPVAMATLVLVFRDDIRTLLGRLKNARAAGVQAIFEPVLEQAEEATSSFTVPRTNDPFIRWERLTPRSAVLVLWVDVERELRELAKAALPAADLNAPPMGLASNLRHSEILNEEQFQALFSARNVRYAASQPGDEVAVTMEEARRFADVAGSLTDLLKRKRREVCSENVTLLKKSTFHPENTVMRKSTGIVA